MSEVILPDHLVNNQAPTSTRDRILVTAIQLLSQYNYSDVSLDMIAKHCSSTKQCILYHFRSKRNLTLEILNFIKKQHQLRLDGILDNTASPEKIDELTHLVDQLLFVDHGGQCLCRLVTSTHPTADFELPIRDYFKIWETAIKHSINLPEEKASVLARIVISELIGAIISSKLYRHKDFHKEVLNKLKADLQA